MILNLVNSDEGKSIQSAFTPRAASRHAKFTAEIESSPSDESEPDLRSRKDRIGTPATTLGGTFGSEDDMELDEDTSRRSDDFFGMDQGQDQNEESDDNDF